MLSNPIDFFGILADDVVKGRAYASSFGPLTPVSHLSVDNFLLKMGYLYVHREWMNAESIRITAVGTEAHMETTIQGESKVL